MPASNPEHIRLARGAATEPIGSAGAARLLWIAGSLVALTGLVVELVHTRTHAPAVERLVELCSLSYEANVPTWYATCLLFSCAVVLGVIAANAPARRAHWTGLAVGFTVMSIDEAVELHERLGGLIGTHGVLYFDWIVPAAAVVLVLAIAYVPFLRALPPRRRRWFVVAGAIYVAGAVGMELPLGWWTERAGDDNATYALIDWVEETMELVGASVFLLALLDRWRDRAEASP